MALPPTSGARCAPSSKTSLQPTRCCAAGPRYACLCVCEDFGELSARSGWGATEFCTLQRLVGTVSIYAPALLRCSTTNQTARF